MLPLSMIRPGEKGRIIAIQGGTKLKKRLADLGLNIGMTVGVVADTGGGPVILAVKDCRLAIGRGMLSKIQVELVPEQCCS